MPCAFKRMILEGESLPSRIVLSYDLAFSGQTRGMLAMNSFFEPVACCRKIFVKLCGLGHRCYLSLSGRHPILRLRQAFAGSGLQISTFINCQ